jgi:hypothetical protein
MPGPIRTPDEIAAMKARARERRAGGEAMQDIAEALGVPASTLYRWAAEGGWRGRDLARERYRAAIEGAACGGFSGKVQSDSLLPLDGGGAPKGRRGCSESCPGSANHPSRPPDGGHPPHQGEGGAIQSALDEDAPAPPMTPEEARAAGEKALRAARALMEAGDLRGADLAMRLSERMLDAAKALAALPKPEGYRPPSNLPLDIARLILGYRMALEVAQGLRPRFIADPSKLPPPPEPGEHITGKHHAASGLPMADGGTYPDIPRSALMWPWRPETGAEGEDE